MTVSSAIRKAGPFAGNGSATSFPFSFKVFDKTDVSVLRVDVNGNTTMLVLDSDFSVVLSADQNNSPGGSITYPVSGDPLPKPYQLVVLGDLAYDQPTDITNQGGFYPSVEEDAFDRATIQIQQIKETLGRALIVGPADTAVPTLPSSAARAGTVLGFDAAGNLETIPLPAAVGAGDLLTDTFTAGTDFTPGTTLSVTLARAPGTIANLSVHFDAAYQGPDSIASLTGTVLTFTSPIPVGTKRVYVTTGTSLSVNIPPAGAVAAALWSPIVPIVGTAAALSIQSELDYIRGYLVNVKRFGVVGDGVADDTAAMQKAIEARVGLWIPWGCNVRITASLKYHPMQVIIGADGYQSKITADGAFPAFINDPLDVGDFNGGLFRSFTVYGGTYAFQITPVDNGPAVGVQSLCVWEDIRFERQILRGLQHAGYFIGNTLRNVVFYYCGGGFYFGQAATLNLFDCCRWEGLTDTHAYFDCVGVGGVGGENNVFINPRHEAIPDGSPDLSTKNVYVLDKCYSTKVIGGYFENTFQNIVYAVGGDGMAFDGTWFTGQSLNNTAPAGVLKSEVFNSEMPMTFNGCKFLTGSEGNVNGGMVMLGFNDGLETRGATVRLGGMAAHQNERITIRSLPLTSGVANVPFKFTRSDLTNALTNAQAVTGTVRISIQGATTAGSPFSYVREYLLNIQGFANLAPTIAITQMAASDVPAGSTLAVTPTVDATSAWLAVTLTQADLASANAQVTLDYQQDGSLSNGQMTLLTL